MRSDIEVSIFVEIPVTELDVTGIQAKCAMGIIFQTNSSQMWLNALKSLCICT